MPAAPIERPQPLGFRLAHRAMRGDARRLADLAGRIGAGVVVCDRRRAAALADYVCRVCDGVHLHHDIEDRHLWPVIDRAAGAEVDLAELSDDHRALESLLDQVRAAVTAFAAAPSDRVAARRLAQVLEGLRDLLDEHIEEEERTVLPLVERYVSAADWRRVEAAARLAGDPWFDLPRIERFAAPDELAELHALAGPVLRVALLLLRPVHRRRERLIFGQSR
ncbi:hemerythrin domain-containing protein [Catellatospora sp. NPDC049133]|uniref:hemerythrin domain-containing protein n=1 Tax=Catellatospora sp. NPDC049133 TaxID=3155499 RepID=UPI0033D0085C